jgi:tetratricopeptide (TPR) repeat protein
VALVRGARLLVNGFHAALDQQPGAKLARAVFLTALQQSPRIRAISDQDLLPSLRQIKVDAALPVEGDLLRQLISRQRAAYWIGGQLQANSGRYSLSLDLMQAAGDQPILQLALRDVPQIAALAEQVATRLREEIGESRRSIEVNPAMVRTFTSSVPEALQKYYDAMEHYAVGEMPDAIPLLRDAIELDPQFAQAHNIFAMCLNSASQYQQAFENIEVAHRLSVNLPVAEKAWTDTNFFMLTEDPDQMVTAARREVALYPDEPRFQRILAYVLCRTGRATESIQPIRAAVELSPDNALNINELIVDLCEAGRFAEGLTEYQRARQRGLKSTYLARGVGLAYLGLEQYAEASEAFESISGDNTLLIQGARILAGDLESATAELEREVTRNRMRVNATEEHRTHEFLCGTYFLTDRFEAARRHLKEMTGLPAFPPFAKHLECTAFWAARLNDDSVLDSAARSLGEIAVRWPNDRTHSMAAHAMALTVWRRNDFAAAEAKLLESLGASPTVWGMFDLADLYSATGRPALAEEQWRRFEAARGTILKLWFTGSLLYGWLNRALAANRRGDQPLARECANKILTHWAHKNAGVRIVALARSLSSQ